MVKVFLFAAVLGIGLAVMLFVRSDQPTPKTALQASTTQQALPPKIKVEWSAEAKEVATNGRKGLYTILLLHRGENTAPLQDALQPMASDTGKCAYLVARADEAGMQPLLQELNLDPATAPTPLAIAIAPNRVVTGAFMRPPTKAAFREAILPEQPLAVRKALLNGKNVIVKMQSPKTTGNRETNEAVEAYLADPKLKGKFVVVPVDLNKAENTPFLKQLKIDPSKETESILLGMAPPLKIVNKPFRGPATPLDVGKAVDPACATGCGPGG